MDDSTEAVKKLNLHLRIGPPGTGKTTWCVEQANAAVKAAIDRGMPIESAKRSVLFSSLTNAAVKELQGRSLMLDEDCVGTLHSHAYRAIGRPKLCVDKKVLLKFNDSSKYTLTEACCADGETRRLGMDRGDDLLFESYHLNRSRMIPFESWDLNVKAFAEAYDQWKRVNGLVDFSDVIHDAIERVPCAPGSPRVIFVDEAQDHDRQQFELVKKWAAAAEITVVVGDPAQAIFEWRGSDPAAFYALPHVSKKVLEQSYRLPRAVFGFAQQVIAQADDLEPAAFHPRDADGKCEESRYSPCNPVEIGQFVDEVEGHLETGKRVMVLASCRYMLESLASRLRKVGLPFHNPYSPRSGFNPLQAATEGKTPAWKRMTTFMQIDTSIYGDKAKPWTWSELAIVVKHMSAKAIRSGMTAEVEAKAESTPHEKLTREWLKQVFTDEAYDKVLAGADLEWYVSVLQGSKSDSFNYPLAIYRRLGLKGLTERPRLVLGSIHSVKGGEAEIVYVCPDLSYKAYQSRHSLENQLHRQFYVAVTRAKESLFYCKPSPIYSGMYYRWP